MLQFIGCAFLLGIFVGFVFILVKAGIIAALIFLAIIMALGVFSKNS